MFKAGELVKSKNRTDEYQLFLMVIEDHDQTVDQFKAVVLVDLAKEYARGETANNWVSNKFETTSWNEIKPYM